MIEERKERFLLREKAVELEKMHRKKGIEMKVKVERGKVLIGDERY